MPEIAEKRICLASEFDFDGFGFPHNKKLQGINQVCATSIMSSILNWPMFSRSAPNHIDTIELRHGKLAYNLTFAPNTLATIPISHLKALAREKANLPDDVDIKFFFQGRRLDDTAEAKVYNIQDGRRILMTSSKPIERPYSSPTTATATTSINGSTTGSSSSHPTPTITPLPPQVVAPQSPLDKIY